MKALVARQAGALVAGEAPSPASPGPSQLLVRNRVSAVSAGTERRLLYGGGADPTEQPPGWPVVGAFGYLAAGEVVAVGTDVEGFAIGDRVSCARNYGAHREILDIDAATAVRLPEEISYLGGAISYWAVPPLCGILAARPRFYDDALVTGVGPLGLAAVQLLRNFTRRLVAVDIIPERCRLAEELGADVAVDASREDALTAITEIVPEGPEVVIEVAGTQSALKFALDVVRPLGRIALVGVFPRLQDFELFWPLQHKGAHIVPIHRPGAASPQGGGAGSPREAYLPDVLDMMSRSLLDLERLTSWVVPWEEGPHAMELMHKRPDLCVGLAFAWHPDDVRGMEAYRSALATAGLE